MVRQTRLCRLPRRRLCQPYLLRDIVDRFAATGFGCDISDQVIADNRKSMSGCEFQVLDLTRECWPEGRQFDLVLCSEVLEHLPDWKAAVRHLIRMARKHLLITVPSGPIRTMDRMVGHLQHFQCPELSAVLTENGCVVEHARRWGFPVHSLYKYLISLLSPGHLYSTFSGGKPYGLAKKGLCQILYSLFFLNDLGHSGDQLFVYARRPSSEPQP